ncbi:aminoglycoside phosphotransferase family protein [Actinotalea solisilvae]|uniref:aminoglycoside phosphotransferase family protein n=1 Tax=Actinotalea solisilvae TaxID=2072922 RepID=UPI001F22B798|nr:aminoglycoside phosphotransferase family protein [Actinotalea solisilvae]
MHEGEVPVDADVVRRLLASQLPALAGLPVREVRSTGTVNAVYRLGDHLCVRLPRLAHWQDALDRETRWLPVLAARLPLAVPEPVAVGRPDDGYPHRWAVYRWIEGATYDDGSVADEVTAAHDLAAFVRALRTHDVVPDAPRTGRRPLRELDAPTRGALDEIAATAGARPEVAHADDSGTRADAGTRSAHVDVAAAREAWDLALEAPAWDGEPVWVHTDLLRPNLLVRDGRLAAVLDFGAVGVGDPAADVVPAWSVLGPDGRAAYRRALDVDDATWARARGYALHQAALIIPYYRVTNPGFVTTAVRTVAQVLQDLAH